MYPQGSVTEYELNESVELNGYSASVSSYKVMSIEDFLNEYGLSLIHILYTIFFLKGSRSEEKNKECSNKYSSYSSIITVSYTHLMEMYILKRVKLKQ